MVQIHLYPQPVPMNAGINPNNKEHSILAATQSGLLLLHDKNIPWCVRSNVFAVNTEHNEELLKTCTA